jgi:hypothetical protein
LKDKPIFISKQNILFPLGVMLFSISLVLGLLYLVELHGKAPQKWKIMVIGITTLILTAHMLKRILSWKFMFYEDRLTISRPFGLIDKREKDILLSDIEKIHLSLGFRRNCQLSVHTKTGKRLVSFFDVTKIHAPAELIALCLKNGIEFTGSGGKWDM